jgi:VCBS repeat-containing protein
VAWSYSVDNEKLRHLGKDATAAESFILTLSDGTATSQQTVVVTEHGINDAPTSTSTLPAQQAVAASTSTWVLPFDQFTDPDDADVLTWTALEHGTAALPTWLAYNPGTRTFTATPVRADAGTYTIDTTATDTHGETATAGYSLVVTLPPPVATPDTATWTLPEQLSGAFVSRTFSTNVLTNDVGTAALAATGGGTWKLDGDPDVAGTFTVTADGTLTMNSGTDPLGPVQELGTDIKQTATLTYTASDGGGSATGAVTITVVGALDPIVVLGQFAGPDQVVVWFNDPVPIYFDSRGCISDPEGAALLHSWEAQTTVAPHPPLSFAFLGGTNVPYVEEMNGDWGFNSEVTVRLTIYPFNGKPFFYQQIEFGVGDPSDDTVNTGLATVPECAVASTRPYTPDFGIIPGPANTLDLRDHGDGATTYTFANVLTSVLDPGGLAFTAFGRGTIGDPADHHGTYVINPNGTITATLDPAHPIPDGQTVDTVGPYRVTNSAGTIGVGAMTFRIVGRS